MLEELGVSYEHVPAMPQSPQVKQYNPLGKIPVLIEDDDFVMYESGAIMTYLGDKYRNDNNDSSSLVPLAGTRQRGKYEQTMSVLLTELDAQGLLDAPKTRGPGRVFHLHSRRGDTRAKIFSQDQSQPDTADPKRRSLSIGSQLFCR